jgi:hypothetical protein
MQTKMLFFINIWACIFLVACQRNLTSGDQSLRIIQQLQASEINRFQATTTQDSLMLEQLINDSLHYTHSNGLVESKRTHIRNIMSGTIRYENMQRESISTRVLSPTIAINNGIVKVNGIYKGTAFILRLQYSALYVKSKKQSPHWQLINWQSTKL